MFPLLTVAQTKALWIGDKVPELHFNLVNSSLPSVKLSDYKGKLVILDFWATWCSACIGKFPKMQQLQADYKDKLQVLLVNTKIGTGDTREKILAFFKKREANGQSFNLATAVEEEATGDLFPHMDLPHYVWISPEGKVVAITDSKEVNPANINALLNNEVVNIPVKKDFMRNELLAINDVAKANQMEYYSFFKKGRLEGIMPINDNRVIKDVHSDLWYTRGRAMINLPLIEMYETIVLQIHKFYVKKNRTIIDVKNPSEILYDSTKLSREEWEKENLFSYDLILPVADEKKVFDQVLSDLNRFSGYNGRIEKRIVKCWIINDLVKKPTTKPVNKSKQERILKGNEVSYLNTPSSTVFSEIWKIVELPVFIYAKDLDRNIDLKFDIINPDIVAMKKALNRYGYDIIEQKKELDMFVLTENKQKQ